MADLFRLPDGNVQIAFSGGRTSAYMLKRLIDANPNWPDDRVQVTFQNTGREMPETLDFVRDVELHFGVPVTWLEYRGEGSSFEIVDWHTASRNGEPFEQLIRKRKYLPNQNMRFCTEELKIRTAKRYLRWLGWDYWTNCVGIRADEPHRLNKAPPKDRWTVWRPLVDDGIGKHDISAFWKAQTFDLQLANINGTTPFGNCDGCFLKGEKRSLSLYASIQSGQNGGSIWKSWLLHSRQKKPLHLRKTQRGKTCETSLTLKVTGFSTSQICFVKKTSGNAQADG